jgi:hypothetical protein
VLESDRWGEAPELIGIRRRESQDRRRRAHSSGRRQPLSSAACEGASPAAKASRRGWVNMFKHPSIHPSTHRQTPAGMGAGWWSAQPSAASEEAGWKQTARSVSMGSPLPRDGGRGQERFCVERKGDAKGLADRQGPRRYDGRDSSSGSRAAGGARRPEETFHQDRECCAPRDSCRTLVLSGAGPRVRNRGRRRGGWTCDQEGRAAAVGLRARADLRPHPRAGRPSNCERGRR